MATIFFVHDTQESPTPRQQYLEAAGHTVHLFKNGFECLSVMRDARPDLLLLDVLLEGPNGFDVVTELRRSTDAKTLPVILCSGLYTARSFQDASHQAGAQAYLLRPFELSDLGDEVTLQLRLAQSQRAGGVGHKAGAGLDLGGGLRGQGAA